ncbi:MAG TPA: class I SAM-dependent methyltransferase [Malonomonas sp.]
MLLRPISAFLMAHAYDWAMQRSERLCLSSWRAELLSNAQGRVLEIGAGTGINLQHYPPQTELILSEPDRHMRGKLQRRLQKNNQDQRQLVNWSADAIDRPDDSVDSIVSTLVLCSVSDLQQSLAELYRVLRPGGALLFLEHVIALNPATIRWQQRIEPLWSCCCGNCRLTRDTGQAIKTAGFLLESCTDEALPKAPAIVRRTIRGLARKPDLASSNSTASRNQEFDFAAYPACPFCSGSRVGKIVYGKPALTRHILQGLETGQIISGGCTLQHDAPQWHCHQCRKDFGQRPTNGATT